MSLFDDDFDEDELMDDLGGGDLTAAPAGPGLQPPRQMYECLGHQDVEAQILDLINSGHLHHALILSGQEGIGKSTFAYRLARYLLKHGVSEDGDEGGGLFGEPLPKAKAESLSVDPQDQTCRMIAASGHPDLLTIEREFDEKKNRFKGSLGIDGVRRIAPFMHKTASFDGWRVVIVDDADTMTNEAQNAILKVLEEPPPRTILLLVCHRPGMMIPTIRSRARVVHFQPLAVEDFTALVRRVEPGLREGDIKTLYAITNGSVGQAVRLLDEGGLEVIYNVAGLLSQLPEWDWPQIHGLAENLSKPGQENSYQSFVDVFVWSVEAMVRARARQAALPAPVDTPQLARLANHFPFEQWLEICERIRQHFATADYSSLDKRQAILGVFNIFDEARRSA